MSTTPPVLFAFWFDLVGFVIAAVILGFLCLCLNPQTRLPAPPLAKLPPIDPFSAQQITRTFVAALPNLTRELNLEVATTRQVEFFERTDQRSLLGISLGTNVARVRLPVTYRYHLRLADPWRLEVEGSHLIIHAPLLRASLPPAIHTDEMDVHTERGWCRSTPEDLLRELHRDVTPLISQWASNEQHLGMVRETARLQVA
ncbi:MAG: hypothetical protein EBY17_30005, partial [Acidobacteriia bacterium]|nr:hypothetical protein [Terriglobia bacterium]